MPFLYYIITLIAYIVVSIFGLLLWAGIADNPEVLALAVIAGIIAAGVLFVRHKVTAHHAVQRHLSQRNYNRKMRRINRKGDSGIASASTSANIANMTAMATIIKSEASKRKSHITPNNFERINSKLSFYVTTNSFASAYTLHQLIINTEPKQLNQELNRLLDN